MHGKRQRTKVDVGLKAPVRNELNSSSSSGDTRRCCPRTYTHIRARVRTDTVLYSRHFYSTCNARTEREQPFSAVRDLFQRNTPFRVSIQRATGRNLHFIVLARSNFIVLKRQTLSVSSITMAYVCYWPNCPMQKINARRSLTVFI